MKSIIPEQSQSTIFDKLIQAAMDDFISEGEVLVLIVMSVNSLCHLLTLTQNGVTHLSVVYKGFSYNCN